MKGYWGTTLIIGLIALATASAVSAASPRQIVRDYADNGRLDGNYSAAEIQSALQNPTVQAYISPTEQTGLVRGAQKVRRQNVAPATAEVARQQQLPFTGQDITVLLIGGLLLLVAGGALRLVGRPSPTPPRS